MTPRTPIAIEGTTGSINYVDVGATFLTGIEVDVAPALVDPSVVGPGERLTLNSSIPFRSTRVTTQRGDGSFYAIDGQDHGTEVVPRTLATVDPAWLLENCELSGGPVGWALESLECDIHDFGVGMVILRWRPEPEQDVVVEELDAMLACLTRASREVLSDLTERIARACQVALRDDPARLELAHGLDVQDVAVLPPVGEVLWMWHLLGLSCTAAEHPDLARRVASVVCPNDYTVLELRDHTFAAGVHASVACSSDRWESDAGFLAKAPRSQDAWWTLYWRLDRVLLALQLRLEANLSTQALPDLVVRAEILSDVASRVSLLRSRLDSLLVASGARDIKAWDALSQAWDLAYRVSAVQLKMQLLTKAYADVLLQISAARSARVNFMIYVFTAFSVVASVVAVAQFAQGSADTGGVVRLVTIVGSVVGALLAVLLSVRTTRAIRRRQDAR